MTESEKFVFELCNLAFLKLWSHPNPLGKKEKELCDVLIVCGNDVIIISVKHIQITSKGDIELEEKRWIKRAIEDSVKQIYGAERIIALKEKIKLKDNETLIELPPKKDRKTHRIAVAIGRGDKHSLKFGEFGKGFIHVFDEESIHAVLTELDTIADFLKYLIEKEKLIISGTYPLYKTEKHLLAWYILSNRTFSSLEKSDVMIFEDDLWNGMKENNTYQEMRNNEKDSYYWDEIIETFTRGHFNDKLLIPIERNSLDKSIRMMARESRFARQILSESYLDFIGFRNEIKAESRIVKSPTNSNVIYVFLLREADEENRELKVQDLILRCHAARQVLNEGDYIVGIGTEKYNPKNYSYDMCCLDTRIWDKEDQDYAISIIENLGYFKNALKYSTKHIRYDE